MGMPVSVMLRNMTHAELVEWAAFERVEPFGPLRDDYRAGTIAAQVVNMLSSKRNAKRPTWQDFMPTDAKPRVKAQPASVLRKKAQAMIKAFEKWQT